MSSKKPAKKTVRRRESTATPDVAQMAAEPQKVVTVPLPAEAPVQSGPVSLSAEPVRVQQRLLQKLITAEEEAANFAAIADGLLDSKNRLEQENRVLLEKIRELELQLFEDEESDGGE